MWSITLKSEKNPRFLQKTKTKTKKKEIFKLRSFAHEVKISSHQKNMKMSRMTLLFYNKKARKKFSIRKLGGLKNVFALQFDRKIANYWHEKSVRKAFQTSGKYKSLHLSLLLLLQGVQYIKIQFTITLRCTDSQKHESTLLHKNVLNEFLTADRSCTNKYFWKNFHKSW